MAQATGTHQVIHTSAPAWGAGTALQSPSAREAELGHGAIVGLATSQIVATKTTGA